MNTPLKLSALQLDTRAAAVVILPAIVGLLLYPRIMEMAVVTAAVTAQHLLRDTWAKPSVNSQATTEFVCTLL
jgi:hypothetical protein